MAWFSRVWVPLAIAVTGLCGLTFLAVQQSYRMNLNDPQVEIAENAADGLLKGAVPSSFVQRGAPHIDIALSLSPWIAIYDASGVPLESDAVLLGAPPKVPLGALQAARDASGKAANQPNENRITWQPSDSVRQALVIKAVNTGSSTRYVVAGRNMREVENRIWQTEAIIGIGWIVLLAATLLAAWIGARLTVGTGIVW